MRYYLIENLRGFERPVETDDPENLKALKDLYDRDPARKVVGSNKNRFEVQATYYIVPKDDWDTEHCPLIPVDLS
jgi:hypothetical protein